MKTVSASELEFDFRVEVPDDWYLVRVPVPRLVVPRQLFGASNEEFSTTPSGSSQPRPMIQLLSSEAVFLWGCFQRHSDPDPLSPDPILDNTRFGFPLDYDSATARDSADAREWLPSRFVWKRVGYQFDGLSISVWIWEGTSASSQTIDDAREILRNLVINMKVPS